MSCGNVRDVDSRVTTDVQLYQSSVR
eukprot:COSAG05_NODE_10977_length_536_cov_1.247140_3_plen_25_part_01